MDQGAYSAYELSTDKMTPKKKSSIFSKEDFTSNGNREYSTDARSPLSFTDDNTTTRDNNTSKKYSISA